MSWKTLLTQKLVEEFERLKSQNPKFSLRQYAKRLKVSPTTLSDLLKGKSRWNLTAQRALEIVDGLDYPEETKNWLRARIGFIPQVQKSKIAPKDFKILLQPESIPVACAFDLPEEETTPQKISDRFGLPEQKVRKIINELIAAGYLEIDPQSNKITKRPLSWSAGDGPSDLEIQRYHKFNMQMAASAIDRIPSHIRHYSSATFTGNSEQIKNVRREIQAFSEKIKLLLNTGEPNDEVFRFSVCLYPIHDIPKDNA